MLLDRLAMRLTLLSTVFRPKVPVEELGQKRDFGRFACGGGETQWTVVTSWTRNVLPLTGFCPSAVGLFPSTFFINRDPLGQPMGGLVDQGQLG